MKYKIVELTCGLGNQMFQYAFAKSLEHHLQIPILLDKTWYETEGKNHSIPFSLDLFKIDLPYATQEQIAYAKSKASFFDKQPKMIRSILKRIRFPRATSSCATYDKYIAEYLKPNSFIYFYGWFQNSLYFKDISSHIKKILSPPPIKSEVNKQKLEQILQAKNSCFIHIRKGDYCTHSWLLGNDEIFAKIGLRFKQKKGTL